MSNDFNTIRNVVSCNSFMTAFQKLMLDFNIDVMMGINVTDLYQNFLSNLERDYAYANGLEFEYPDEKDFELDETAIIMHKTPSRGLPKDAVKSLKPGTVVKVSTYSMNYIGMVSKVDPDHLDGTIYFHIGMSDIDNDGKYDVTNAFYNDAVYNVMKDEVIVDFPADIEYDMFVNMMEEESVKYLTAENLLIPC